MCAWNALGEHTLTMWLMLFHGITFGARSSATPGEGALFLRPPALPNFCWIPGAGPPKASQDVSNCSKKGFDSKLGQFRFTLISFQKSEPMPAGKNKAWPFEPPVFYPLLPQFTPALLPRSCNGPRAFAMRPANRNGGHL